MTHHHSPAPFSRNPDFDFEIRTAIGLSVEGAGEPGEILAAVAGVGPADHEAWSTGWQQLGERVLGIAERAASDQHRFSAGAAFLRASAYLSVAVGALSALDDDARLDPTFTQQERAWAGFIAHAPIRVDTVAIPYGDSTLPAWFFRSADDDLPRPTLIAVNGSDGSRASLWASCAAPALRRGYHVLIFDGPGQQSQLFDQHVSFRPDWEHVLTPVFDCVVGLAGVDPDRIVGYGISQGSYWLARALAFEHRFAAGITDPGLVDVAASWTSQIPGVLLRTLDAGHPEKFDREMALGMRLSPETARTWRFRARPYGTTGYADTIQEVRKYTVAQVASQIRTPLLVLSPEGEQFWPGQAERLVNLVGDSATLVRFTAAEGADGHCQPLARALTAARVFDWLDEQLHLE